MQAMASARRRCGIGKNVVSAGCRRRSTPMRCDTRIRCCMRTAQTKKRRHPRECRRPFPVARTSLSLPSEGDCAQLFWQKQHQLIEARDEGDGVVELRTFGEGRLVEQDVRPVVETLLVLLVVQTRDEWMSAVDLQDGLDVGHLV